MKGTAKTIAISTAVLAVHSGIGFYSLARLLPFLQAELDRSITHIALTTTLYMLALSLTGPLAGYLSDKHAPKKLILYGAIISCGAFLLLAFIKALWCLYAAYLLIGVGMGFAGITPVSKLVTSLAEKKGASMGVVMSGLSIGAVLFPPFIHILVLSFRWRGVFLLLSAVVLVLMLLPVLLLPVERPGSTKQDTKISIALIKSLLYSNRGAWLLLPGFFLIGISMGGILNHAISIFVSRGVPMGLATLYYSLMVGIGLGGRLFFGFFADRSGAVSSLFLCAALQFLAVTFLLGTSIALVQLFLFFFGFSVGGNYTIQPLIVKELIPDKVYGTALGIVLLSSTTGMALGPSLLAQMIARWDSHRIPAYFGAAAYLAALLALVFLYKGGATQNHENQRQK